MWHCLSSATWLCLPDLLGVRPSLHPVGEARDAVVDPEFGPGIASGV